MESIIIETAQRIFADLADPQEIIRTGNDAWKGPLWSALEEVGLSLAWVSDDVGGGGISLNEGFGVIRAAGRAALAVPLAETLLAGWALEQVAIALPGGPMSIAPTQSCDRLTIDEAGRISGRASKVPYAGDVQHLVVLAFGSNGHSLALVRTSDCKLTLGKNLAGDPRATVEFSKVVPLHVRVAPDGLDDDALLLMGAAARAQQIAGALETVLDLSVRYATERVAFEKPISKFQAVQHNLARLGGEVAASVSAAVSAADTVSECGTAGEPGLLEIAAAKIRCGEAAEIATGIAHQVHGAIGFTDEHILHRFSLRALAWREDFGDENFWSIRLGTHVVTGGADRLWPMLASR